MKILKWCDHMTIGAKLLIAFIVVGAITAAVGLMGISSLSKVADLSNAMYQNQTLGIAYLKQAGIDLMQTDRAVKNVLLANTREQREEYKAGMEASIVLVNRDLDKARPLIHTPQGIKMLAHDDAAWKDYQRSARQIVDAAMTEPLQMKRSSIDLSFGDGRQKAAIVEDALTQSEVFKEGRAKQFAEQADSTFRSSRTLLIVMVVVGVFSGILLGLLISRRISKPLNAIAATAKEISMGHVDQKVDYRSGDEVGSLAESFRNLIDYIRGVSQGLERMAAGDLRAAIAPGSDRDMLVNSYLKTIDAVNALTQDAFLLSKAAVQGDLLVRADASRHRGEYRKIVEGVNQTLDAVVGPIHMASEYVDRIGKGDIPARITASYNGDFDRLKNSLNACIDGLGGLVEANAVLNRLTLNDCTAEMKGAYQGVFNEVAEATRGVRGRFESIRSVFNAVASGDFDEMLENLQKIGKRSENDTIMPAAIRTMTSIQALVQDADMLETAAATGQIHVRADASRHQGEYRRVVEGMNHTLEAIVEPLKAAAENAASLASSSEELTAVSQQMAGNAEETAMQANIVSEASDQVSKNVASVATASEQMQSSIREIAKNANDSAHVAKTAVAVASTTNETMKRLGESSQEIGNVIKVINSIAEQTNLLALNATIEAARAGEAGKGFAVVANEVKELAKQTARATEEIGQKIEAIQEVTTGAVSAIEEIGAIINQINDISNSIASAVEEQTVTTNEIGRSVTEAAQGVTDIARNIGGVAKAAKNTTHGANDTKRASLELSEMAARLQSAVSKFTF